MSLDEYEPTLEECAETGQFNHEQWPAILEPLLERLNHIAYNDFPVPRPYPIINPVLPSQRSSDPDRFLENPPTLPPNIPVTPNTPRTLPPVPPFPSSNTSRVPDSQTVSDGQNNTTQVAEQLPAEVLQILNGALAALKTTFQQRPPHTIQRLAELVLYPRKHYRTLPAWLRALDRVASVSSGADVFPLSDIPPQLNNGVGGVNGTDIGGILFANSSNEIRNGYDRDALGSDESLGGALLTPIPWLKNKEVLADSGDSEDVLSPGHQGTAWPGSGVEDDDFIGDTIIDTAATIADAQAIAAVAEEHANNSDLGPARQDGAVTQGELIRMEQEAGVVPVPHEDIGRIDDDEFEIGMDDEGEGMPHARGPDVVGTVDMGLVGGQERQVRISSPPHDDERSTGTNISANNAQDVLEGGVHKSDNTQNDKTKSKSGSESDDYVHVSKEAGSGSDKKDGDGDSPMSDDGDVVLVDADGAQATDSSKADKSGVNVGPDAADSTAQ